MGKNDYKWPCSIAMLNYQRVTPNLLDIWPYQRCFGNVGWYPLTRLHNSQEKHIKQPMTPTIKLQETIHKPTTYKGWHMLAWKNPKYGPVCFEFWIYELPGKLTACYGKSPSLIGKSTNYGPFEK
jgi:hypothetical protein